MGATDKEKKKKKRQRGGCTMLACMGSRNGKLSRHVVVSMDEDSADLLTSGGGHYSDETLTGARGTGLFSWGSNTHQQLALGSSSSNVKTPNRISELDNLKFTGISCGGHHCIAISEDGRVFGWGSNRMGQLSDVSTGDDESFLHPKPVCINFFNTIRIKSVSAGEEHCLASEEGGMVYAWGNNMSGQCCGGMALEVRAPTAIGQLKNFKTAMVSCGDQYSMVLTEDGHVYTFGNGRFGRLGYEAIKQRVPRMVPLFNLSMGEASPKVKFIAAGGSHAMAVTEAGKVVAWGSNTYGQLGQGEHISGFKNPVYILGLDEETIVKVACGSNHTLAMTDQGRLYSWGVGRDGQLGHGDTLRHYVPARVKKFDRVAVKDVGCGPRYSTVQDVGNMLYTFGYAHHGRLGKMTPADDITVNAPQKLGTFREVRVFGCGYEHMVVYGECHEA